MDTRGDVAAEQSGDGRRRKAERARKCGGIGGKIGGQRGQEIERDGDSDADQQPFSNVVHKAGGLCAVLAAAR